MVNQSLQFLEYFCFTFDYSLHLLYAGMLNKNNFGSWERYPQKSLLGLYVPNQVYTNALKIAGSIYKTFLQCKHYNYQLFGKIRAWQTPSRSLITHIREVKQGRVQRSHLLTAQRQDVWIKATERIIWMMFNFGNIPISKSMTAFCYYRGDLKK